MGLVIPLHDFTSTRNRFTAKMKIAASSNNSLF